MDNNGQQYQRYTELKSYLERVPFTPEEYQAVITALVKVLNV